MWFRNVTAEVLHIADLAVRNGPGGEFEWPGWDHKVHGVLTGHVPISGPGGDEIPYPEPEPAATDAGATTPVTGSPPAETGTAQGAPARTPPPATDPPAGTEPAGEQA